MPKTTVQYHLSFPQASAHLANVHMATAVHPGAVELVMPVWTPGSYKIRDFPRHLRPLEVTDGEGQGLPFRKVRKNRWALEIPSKTVLNVRYQVYGFEFTVRTNHIDDSHAFMSSANTFFYLDGQRGAEFELRVEAPEAWTVTCPLKVIDQVAKNDVTYLARDFDELVDSPILCGCLEIREFEAADIPHTIAVYGSAQRTVDEWLPPFKKIIEAETKFFGSSPLKRYLFQVNLVNDRGGGLEHKNSAVIQFNNQQLRTRKDWLRYLSLIAHEYFHVWNGKRIRPAVFEPFDYEREIYTRSLWIVEGITSYYDERMLLYSQLCSVQEYLDMLLAKIKNHARNPGRLHDSLEAASYDAWIKLYQNNENTVNASTSYYQKGQLVATLLDLKIRVATNGERSLDEIMQKLWQDYQNSHGEPYEEGHIETLICAEVGSEFQQFFQKYIRGTAELDWNEALQHFALKLTVKPTENIELAVILNPQTPTVLLDQVLEGGAAEKSGLSARDEIIAVNGRKVMREDFERRLKDFGPGDVLNLTLFRGGELREMPVCLGRSQSFSIDRYENPTDLQKQLFEGWLKQEWDKKLTWLPDNTEKTASE